MTSNNSTNISSAAYAWKVEFSLCLSPEQTLFLQSRDYIRREINQRIMFPHKHITHIKLQSQSTCNLPMFIPPTCVKCNPVLKFVSYKASDDFQVVI